MRISDMMTEAVETVAPSTTVEEARTKMLLGGIHHLVVREGKRVLGVVSAHDIASDTGTTAVRELMVGDVATAAPDTTVRQAANLLRGRAIGCLPIMDDGRLVGIVTVSDLLELVGRGAERPVARTHRWTLKNRGPRKRLHNRAG